MTVLKYFFFFPVRKAVPIENLIKNFDKKQEYKEEKSKLSTSPSGPGTWLFRKHGQHSITVLQKEVLVSMISWVHWPH